MPQPWLPPPAEAVRGVLGLLAMAREPLSRDHLMAFLTTDAGQQRRPRGVTHLGFLPLRELQRHLETVLHLAQEFFDPLDPAQGAAAPYRFFHTQLSRIHCRAVIRRGAPELSPTLSPGVCVGCGHWYAAPWGRIHATQRRPRLCPAPSSGPPDRGPRLAGGGARLCGRRRTLSSAASSLGSPTCMPMP